jgi:hypothetical protein
MILWWPATEKFEFDRRDADAEIGHAFEKCAKPREVI